MIITELIYWYRECTLNKAYMLVQRIQFKTQIIYWYRDFTLNTAYILVYRIQLKHTLNIGIENTPKNTA